MVFKTSADSQNAAERIAREFRKDLNNPRGRVKVYPVEVHPLFSIESDIEWVVEVN